MDLFSSVLPTLDPSKEIPPVFFFAFLCLLRIFVAWPFVRFFLGFKASDARSAAAAASITCQAHGGPIALFSLYLLSQTFSGFSDFDLSLPFSRLPSAIQPLAATQANYLSAYMAYDTIFMLLNEFLVYGRGSEPLLVPYVQHHVACLLYASSARYYQAGHVSLLLLVFLGEVTNPLQNFGAVASHGVHFFPESKAWRYASRAGQPPFALFFAVVRFAVAPLVCLYFSHHFFYLNVFGPKREGGVPAFCGVLWTLLFVAVVHGSIPFGIDNLREAGFLPAAKKEEDTKKGSSKKGSKKE